MKKAMLWFLLAVFMVLEGFEEKGVMLFYETLGLTDVSDFHSPTINQFHDGFEVELGLATSLEHMDMRRRVVIGPEKELETVFAQDGGHGRFSSSGRIVPVNIWDRQSPQLGGM
jgi:hypothetical protein